MSLFIFSGDLNGDTSDFDGDFKEDLMSTCEVQGHVVKIPCLLVTFHVHLYKLQKKKLKQTNTFFVTTKMFVCVMYCSTITATVPLFIKLLVTE